MNVERIKHQQLSSVTFHYLLYAQNDTRSVILSVYICAVPFQNGTCNLYSSTSSSVVLNWSPTASILYYQITYLQLNGESVERNITSNNITVTQLTAGYLYTFYLQSFGVGGSSNKSNCSYSTCKLNIFSLTAVGS